jgi:hypothetical protein
MKREDIEKLMRRPSISPDELHKSGVLKLCRGSIYEALRRGDIEHFKIGRKYTIPTQPLREKLGI